MSDKIKSQPRAKPGGETGANGEFYEGGKFIATTDHAKSNKKIRRGTGRQEIEPYTWDVPPEDGMIPILGACSVYVCFDGEWVEGEWRAGKNLILNPHITDSAWRYAGDSAQIGKTKAKFQKLAERYNAGERWMWPDNHPRAVQEDEGLSEPDNKDIPEPDRGDFSP